MPFDGIEYGFQPLIKPPQHHPQTRAVGDLLRRSLEATYMYLRTNMGFVGQVCWQQHPRRDTQQLTYGTLSSIEILAVIQALLPDWATHVIASLNYYIEEQPAAKVGLRVDAGSDVGVLAEQQHKTVRSLAAVNETGPVTFQSGLIEAFVERTTMSSANTEIVFRFGAENDEEAVPVRVRVRPQILTCYWVAIG